MFLIHLRENQKWLKKGLKIRRKTRNATKLRVNLILKVIFNYRCAQKQVKFTFIFLSTLFYVFMDLALFILF